ncbi:alpha/beta hydrolase [Candidatus Saccharibacteria bacterium]|nr:MAG: alpha/beta hydrolase [Candidatus Saccharibacteria bacterium]
MKAIIRFFRQRLNRAHTLHVVDHGGDGPVVIMLHGIASSSANWDHLIPLLKSDYRCISIDLLGFGQSPKPEHSDYTVEQHIQSIHRTIDAIGLRAPFTLIGHSLGSLLATRYARMHPKRINHLIILSPPVYLNPTHITDKGARRKTSAYLAAYRYIRTHEKFSMTTALRLTKILPFPSALVLTKETWKPFIKSLEQCIENQTIIEDIAHVRAPIDIFYGLFDQFIVQKNVKLLGALRNVSVHPVAVDHTVSKRYAASIAKVMRSS